jgi:hypothetical protein
LLIREAVPHVRGTMMAMTSPSDSDTDREIDDTIRMYLVTCYTNAEDGREYTREELEASLATDAGLRAWASDVIGINPDTLVPHTPIGHAFINVCMNAWVGKVRGLSDEDTHSLIMAGLKQMSSVRPRSEFKKANDVDDQQ